MSDRLTFTVHGKPAPQGSKRHVGNGVMVESSKRVKPWREDVRAAAMAAIGERDIPLFPRGVPVMLDVHFLFAWRQKHYRTGRRSDELRDDAPTWHTQKPDADKLMRAICDALTGIIWHDDSQAVMTLTQKRWSGCDEAKIRVMPLT